jgi:Fic family protein
MDNLPEPIELPVVRFDSQTTDYILELEKLRGKALQGTTPDLWFIQLKNAFLLMESVCSSRIEGNHTTVVEYAEKVTQRALTPEQKNEEDFQEIANLERAIGLIENGDVSSIDDDFIFKLHRAAVQGLTRDGDPVDGYRTQGVSIYGSAHEPPGPESVPGYMRYLLQFINQKDNPKYDLLRIAIAHHRFVWIHPFTNGNGRTARLLTYAMLLKAFDIPGTHIINPTAIFCSDRKKYYEMLSIADSCRNDGVCAWCDYMLQGLLKGVRKIERLSDKDFVQNSILMPMIDSAILNKQITDEIHKILKIAIQKEIFQASDLASIFSNKYKASRTIRELLDAKYIQPIAPNARKYCINLESPLFGTLFRVLAKEGFLEEGL